MQSTSVYCRALMTLVNTFLDEFHPERAAIPLDVIRRCAHGFASDEQCSEACRDFVETSEIRSAQISYGNIDQSPLPTPNHICSWSPTPDLENSED